MPAKKKVEPLTSRELRELRRLVRDRLRREGDEDRLASDEDADRLAELADRLLRAGKAREYLVVPYDPGSAEIKHYKDDVAAIEDFLHVSPARADLFRRVGDDLRPLATMADGELRVLAFDVESHDARRHFMPEDGGAP